MQMIQPKMNMVKKYDSPNSDTGYDRTVLFASVCAGHWIKSGIYCIVRVIGSASSS